MFGIFLQSLFIGYSGAIMPGSLLTYTIEKSMKSGVKAGLMICIGHSLLEFVLVVLLFLGLGKYLGTTPAQIIIGFIGGIILLISGIGMIKDAYSGRMGEQLTQSTTSPGKLNADFKTTSGSRSGNTLVGGIVISASNPYFIVWWAAIGLGLIMNAYNLLGIAGIAIFYIGHIMSDFTWYLFVSALIGKTRNFINMKIHKIIITILAICLLGFGINFIISSAKLILH